MWNEKLDVIGNSVFNSIRHIGKTELGSGFVQLDMDFSVELPLSNCLMSIEESLQIKVPYMISITDLVHKMHLIRILLCTSEQLDQ